jgi:hypothetical protein
MPALPFVPDNVRVDLVQLIGADLDVLNRFHMDFSGTTSAANLSTWASGINTAWGAHLAALAPDQVQLTNVIVTDLSSDISPQGSNATVQSGTRGAGLSAAACLVASLEISRRYRGGHPRIYFPFGIDTDLASAQAWSSTFVGVAQTAINAFMAAALAAAPSGITPIGWTNVSYYHGFTNVTYPSGRTRPRPTVRGTAVTDGVNSILVRQSVGSQRRRNQFQS